MGLETRLDALFFINQSINLIFIIDVCMQFAMPVPNDKTGELIRSHREIARRYLSGWFAIDVISVLPFDLIGIVQPELLGTDA